MGFEKDVDQIRYQSVNDYQERYQKFLIAFNEYLLQHITLHKKSIQAKILEAAKNQNTATDIKIWDDVLIVGNFKFMQPSFYKNESYAKKWTNLACKNFRQSIEQLNEVKDILDYQRIQIYHRREPISRYLTYWENCNIIGIIINFNL